MTKIASLVTAFFVLLFLYSTIIEPNWIQLKRQVIHNADLSKVLREKVIVQISDLHIRRIGYREKRLVKMINSLKPDLIFITGEYIGNASSESKYKPQIEAAKAALSQLRTTYGIWGVIGEGDIYPHEKLEALLGALMSIGINILMNQNTDVNINGHKLRLIGLSTNTKGMGKSFYNTGFNGPTILLSHFPNSYDQIAEAFTVNLEESEGSGLDGWDWQDNAYWTEKTGEIYFAKDGLHTMRIQRREDGVSIDQILLRPSEFRPAQANADTNCPELDLKPGDIRITVNQIADEDIYGDWKKVEDPAAKGGKIIYDGPDKGDKIHLPLAKPVHYFDIRFRAKAFTKYHLWIRMKAHRDRISSDSIYVQFSDALDAAGNEVFRIGTPLKAILKVDLILAGDTHGGQVRIPFLGPLLNIFSEQNEYDSGLFHVENTCLYVNRGIGWSSLPIRFRCPPEITLFEFRQAHPVNN